MATRSMKITVRTMFEGLHVMGLVNFLFLQWLFCRVGVICVGRKGRITSAILLFPVVPLTGWFGGSSYRPIGRQIPFELWSVNR